MRLWGTLGSVGKVACFGCYRWDGGWSSRAYETAEQVPILQSGFNWRETASLIGEAGVDGDGKGWTKWLGTRKHRFHLCTVCCLIFDSDNGFKDRLARKASTRAAGG